MKQSVISLTYSSHGDLKKKSKISHNYRVFLLYFLLGDLFDISDTACSLSLSLSLSLSKWKVSNLGCNSSTFTLKKSWIPHVLLAKLAFCLISRYQRNVSYSSICSTLLSFRNFNLMHTGYISSASYCFSFLLYICWKFAVIGWHLSWMQSDWTFPQKWRNSARLARPSVYRPNASFVLNTCVSIHRFASVCVCLFILFYFLFNLCKRSVPTHPKGNNRPVLKS
jgi:hypothetical protein